MPHWLDIDPHGRVAPQSDEARRALADRAGRFAMLPSAADLLLAVRTPNAGGPAASPRCLLAGDLAGFPIADLIAFLHQSRLSGVLSVASGGVERLVCFKDGEVRSASSEAPSERIGEVAVRLGYLTEQQLAEAAGGRPIGKAFVDRGFMSNNDLWKCFHEQVTAVFHSILLSPEGLFWLLDAAGPDRAGVPLSVNTQTLLMDGIRRIDEMTLFRGKIPGSDAFLRRREPSRPVGLRPAEQQLLDLVDGQRTVAAIAREARLSEFDATKILYHLAEAGYLEAVGAPAATARAGAERLAAIAESMNAILREIAEAVAGHGGLEAFLAGARQFLADPSSRFAPLWKQVVSEPDGTVNPATLLRNLDRLDPPGEPARFLFDGLRELMFFHLFQAGERLPREVDSALSARVKQELEALEPLR